MDNNQETANNVPPGKQDKILQKWKQSSLDEDIEKFFEPSDKESIKDVFLLASETPTEKHRYDEADYKMHRGKSFPHMHQPLKALHSRPSKRHRTSSRPSQTDLAESSKLTSSASTPSTPFSTGTDDKPLIPFDANKAAVHKKVGFYVGDQAQGSMESFSDPLDSERQRLGSITDKAEDKTALVQSPKRVVQIRQLSQEESSSPRSPSISLSIPSHDSAASTPVINEQFQFSPDENSEPKVKFELGQDGPDYEHDGEAKESEEKDTKHRHRHKHRHHHHHHKHRGQEDLAWRQRAGTEMELPETLKRVPTELEEAVTLHETHLNLMASHRFEDVRGMRRHKIQPKSSVSSFVHIGRKDGEGQPIIGMPGKKTFDHRPHEVFVELDELYKTDGEELGWKETARWIKYEEDLEEGAHRWGKPHVATLSFHSLLNLRKCLEQGTVLLDLEEKELPGIAYRLAEAMVIDDQIKPENKSDVMRMLLLRHKHVSHHKQLFTGLRKNFSSNISTTSLTSLNDEKKLPKVSSFATPSEDVNPSAVTPLMMTAKEDGKVDERKHSIPENSVVDFESSSVHSQEDSKKPMTLAIMKKIPEDAEATIVLVGAVDFLDEPTISFVRLSEGLMLPLLLEVPIPIRFMFVLLGPVSNDFDYHEIGRSISTLMSDQKFHNVAYKAEEKRDLLRAINEFLDESIVLPPGDWESKTLLPIQAIQRKSLQLRQRKKSRRKEAEAALYTDEKQIDDPLRRSGRMFGGFINELKKRYGVYLSDFKDAINPQCLAAVVFIYFAALSGAISFGGLLADKTKNLIGVSETLVVTAVGGILFSLLSAQPLMIIGVTGPVLLFDESLYAFCNSYDIEFLSLRVWISFWVAIITTVVVAFEGSFFLRFFTRFTEEILGALISLIFIYESFMKLVEIFQRHPLLASHCDFIVNRSVHTNHSPDSNMTSSVFEALTAVSPDTHNASVSTNIIENVLTTVTPNVMTEVYTMDPLPRNQPNTALLSMILMLSTFFIAYYLREFRNGKYLGRTARRALGDFGVPIAIVIIVLLDYSIKDTFTQKLQVPEGLSPSRPEIRGWIISPLGVERSIEIWLIFASILPAVLLFIMLFMEIQICELIINKKERQLKKGTGYHVDILIMSYINIICGVTGAPWLSAAIVRAISHIMSLTVMSRTHAPGEKSHILEVKEQRLTNFLVSLLVGMSVGMAPLLRLIPVSVLFGVFIYMGVVSMTGVQFFERLQLMLMPVKHHPDAAFVRNVRTWKMHLFTLIQLSCLILLWVVKSTEAAIALPFVLLLMIPIRGQLILFFTEEELRALDGKEAELEDEDEEPDFYEEALLPG